MLALAALTMAGVGCIDQSPLTPSVNEVIVHAVLDVTARDQYVFVQSTTGNIAQQKAVTGASVTITGPDGRALVAEETRDSTLLIVRSAEPRVTTVYRVSLDRYGVTLNGGDRYDLRVELRDGRVVTGHTTIPSRAQVLVTPTPSTIDRLHDTLTLAWRRVPGPQRYEVFVSSPQTSLDSFTIFADTAVSLPGTTLKPDSTPVFRVGATQQFGVSAVDANYYDYFRRASDPFTGSGVINHLTGGIGLFGSIVPVVRRVVTVR